MFRIAQRCRLRVDLMRPFADVGIAEDAHAFGVSGHDAVFDAVVDHLDEVAGAGGAAMKVSVLRGAADLVTAWRARNIADAGSEGLEDRVEPPHGRFGTADHEAIAAFEAPDATARADVQVIDLLGRQLLGTADVVYIVRVPAVDEDVAGFEQRHEVGDGSIDGSRRYHEPDRARLLELLDEIGERRGADSAFFDE